MNTNTTLLSLIAIQAVLCGAGWWVGARVLGLARQAAAHWMAFCLFAALAAMLFMAEPWLPAAAALAGRNLCLLLALMLLRRGCAVFVRGDTADLEQALLLGVSMLALLLIGFEPGEQWVRALTMSSAMGWVLLRGGVEQVRSVGREYGRATGWLLGGAMGGLGIVLMLRALSALVVPPQSPTLDLGSANPASTGMLVLMLLAFTLLQFGLLYLVILRLVRRLRELSSQDPLTRLLNRRAWMQALQIERLRMQRHPQPTAVAMVDVDHFKELNERFGHAQGDRVLREVARCLEETARATDVVARIGADQFAVLLTDTGAEGAAEATERLRLAVAGLNLRVEDLRLPVTVSVGVAVQPAEQALQLSFSSMQLRADEALRRAKSVGGNQVEIDRCPQEAVYGA